MAQDDPHRAAAHETPRRHCSYWQRSSTETQDLRRCCSPKTFCKLFYLPFSLKSEKLALHYVFSRGLELLAPLQTKLLTETDLILNQIILASFWACTLLCTPGWSSHSCVQLQAGCWLSDPTWIPPHGAAANSSGSDGAWLEKAIRELVRQVTARVISLFC